MKATSFILIFLLVTGIAFQSCTGEPEQSRVWEKVEIQLEAEGSYSNPYMDVEVWVDLKGPEFNKRCYGFWDGENTWKIRVMATKAGEWTWKSDSNQSDKGLNNVKGGFIAEERTEEEKADNPLRRGMIKADEKGHSFRYADGTPMFWLADTWWPCMTQRYPWYEDEMERKVGSPEAGFKDYVRFRKEQGYNGCMVIAGFPNWLDEQSGWKGGGWEDEDGNLPFLVKDGKSDLDQLNPAYFRNMDRKVDYLNANGFIPFIETSRRDIGEYWINNFPWPESYARYIRYLCFRYQGNIVFNSPIHLDAPDHAVSKEEWNRAANIIVDEYDWPPFGHLASANPPGNTYHTFGHTKDARWLSFHGVGNLCRDHYLFTTIPEIFRLENPVPIVVNEPYYDGLKWGNDAEVGSDLAAYYSRVALYGCVLSGAMAGHVYGAHHIWRGDEQMPEAFLSQAAGQMRHIYDFLFSEGDAYSDLIEAKSLLRPFQTDNEDDNMGWSYCMRSENMDMFFLYFEKGCRKPLLTGALRNAEYDFHWFDPVTGMWTGFESVKSTRRGFIEFPEFPDGGSVSGTDWALKIKAVSRDAATGGIDVEDRLMAWAFLAFDPDERSPVERAEMLRRAGFTRCGYEGHPRYVRHLEDHIIAYRDHGIEMVGIYMEIREEDPLEQESIKGIIDILKRQNYKTQFWLTVKDALLEDITEEERVEKVCSLVGTIADEVLPMGCKIAMYNHGGWTGNPENQVQVIQNLQKSYNPDSLGIVLNFHHTHPYIDEFPEFFSRVKPYLFVVNTNGMRVKLDEDGVARPDPKILPLGEGDHEEEMLGIVNESGYDGLVGVSDHTRGVDPEFNLKKNRETLVSILDQLKQQ